MNSFGLYKLFFIKRKIYSNHNSIFCSIKELLISAALIYWFVDHFHYICSTERIYEQIGWFLIFFIKIFDGISETMIPFSSSLLYFYKNEKF
jgi:hypothetical protein